MPGTKYTKEFKLKALERLSKGESSDKISKDLKLKRGRLDIWQKEYAANGDQAFSGYGMPGPVAMKKWEERLIEAAIPPARKLLPFGVKAHSFAFRNPAQDSKITILEGSVRSGKTWAQLMKIILLCTYPVAGQRLITGKSKDSVKGNILGDLFEIVGNKNYDYNKQSGELRLFNTNWRVIGGYDESSEKVLRGATVGIAISDELTLHPESFVKMMLSRLSPEGARWYATTNVDSPYHFVKTDIIDNPAMQEYLQVLSFRLTDNPHISAEYRKFIQSSYTGVWKKRFVDGLWVVASGSIYGDVFNEGNIYRDSDRPSWALTRGERTVSIDYGTTNPQVYGDIYDDGKTYWHEHEYYWDSKERGKQKTDAQYADDLINGFEEWPGIGQDRRRWPRIVVDPSAASFRTELTSRGLMVVEADNKVLDGIRRTSAMFANKVLRIHERCKKVRKDIESYSWNEQRSAKGTEEPLKEHDHGCFVSGTRIRTPDGEVQVETLRVGDWVSTPLGACRVLHAEPYTAHVINWNGTRVTPEHPVLTQRGWVAVEEICQTDQILEWSPEYLTGWNSVDTQIMQLLLDSVQGSTSGLLLKVRDYAKVLRLCIEKFGRSIADLFLLGCTYTTKTVTPETIELPIWNFLPRQNTGRDTPTILRSLLHLQTRKTPPKFGIGLQKAESGMLSTWLQYGTRECSQSEVLSVNTAGMLLRPENLQGFASAQMDVKQGFALHLGLTTKPELARHAVRSLVSTAMLKPVHAASLVRQNSGNQSAGRETVYAISTEHGCYFANDVLVSNCDEIRYYTNTCVNDWRLAA